MPNPASLTPRPLYEQVAERLRQRIFARELEPGAWVDELSLCAEWGISRTPMREAIKVLAADGLITMKPRRGAYVTEMSEQDVREAYQLLALLEADAAAQVALHASDAQLQVLADLHATLEQRADQRQAFFAANEDFHLQLLQIEGNHWRQRMVMDLRRVMKLNRHHSLFKAGRVQESLHEHRALMRALLARDALACERLMRAHFAHGLAAAQP